MLVQQTTKTMFLFTFLVASSVTTTTIAQKNSTNFSCYPSASTSPDFQKALDEGINNLESTAESNRHFKYYSPINGYTRLVHVSYLCQGDLEPKVCHECVSRATKTARTSCASWSTEAVVYEEECTFRYSDKPFYGRFDNFSLYSEFDDKSLDPNVVSQFNKALDESVDEIGKALRSSLDSGPKFKVYETKIDDKTTLFTMGECTWDLYQEDCRLCIHECALKVVAEEKEAGRVMLPSCNFRYNTTQFYRKGVDSPPSPRDSGRPKFSPPPPPKRMKRRRKVNKGAAVAGSVGGVAGVLAGGVLSWAYEKSKAMSSGNSDDVEPGKDDPTDDLEDDNLGAAEAIEATDPETKKDNESINDEESKRRNRMQAKKPTRGNKRNGRGRGR